MSVYQAGIYSAGTYASGDAPANTAAVAGTGAMAWAAVGAVNVTLVDATALQVDVAGIGAMAWAAVGQIVVRPPANPPGGTPFLSVAGYETYLSIVGR